MSLLASLLLACAGSSARPASAADTGPPGSCEGEERQVVTDPTMAASGLTFSVQDLQAAAMGEFAGTVDYPSGRVDTELSVSPGAGDAEVATFVAPDGRCLPRYELPAGAILIAGDVLAQVIELRVTAAALDDVAFAAALPHDALNGTAASDAPDGAPDLEVTAALVDGAWEGEMAWVDGAGVYTTFTLPRVAE